MLESRQKAIEGFHQPFSQHRGASALSPLGPPSPKVEGPPRPWPQLLLWILQDQGWTFFRIWSEPLGSVRGRSTTLPFLYF